MPIIPQRQRQQLASSAVGVAPADRSGEMIGRAFGDVGKQLIDRHIDNKRAEAEEEKKRLEQERQAQAKQQQLAAKLEANKASAGFEVQLEESLASHNQEFSGFRGNSQDRGLAFQEQAEQLRLQTAESLSPEARSIFELGSHSTVGSYRIRQTRQAEKDRLVNATADIEAGYAYHAQLAGWVGAAGAEHVTGRLDTLFTNLETFGEAIKETLPADDAAKVTAAGEQMVIESFVQTMIDEDPEGMLFLIDQGSLDERIDAKGQKEIKKAAQDQILGRAEETKRAEQVQILQEYFSVFEQIRRDGKLTNKGVMSIKDPDVREAALQYMNTFNPGARAAAISEDKKRKSEAKSKALSEDKKREAQQQRKKQKAEKSAAYFGLLDRFDTFFDGDAEFREESKKLETLNNFIGDVFKAVNADRISQSQAQEFLDPVNPVVRELTSNLETFDWEKEGWGAWFSDPPPATSIPGMRLALNRKVKEKAEQLHPEDEQARLIFRAELQREVTFALDRAKEANGGPLHYKDETRIRTEIIDRYVKDSHFLGRKFELGQVVQMPNKPAKVVVGFSATGEPLLDDLKGKPDG